MKRKRLALILVLSLAVLALAPFSAIFGSERAPVAVDASFKTYSGVSVKGALRASESGKFVYNVKTFPKKGELTLENETFEYTPKEGKTGKDRFTFTVTDEKGRESLPATVEIDIIKRSAKDTFYYRDMEGDPAHYASLFLKYKGIMSGESFGKDSFFYPDREVTRAQFVAMTAAALNMPVPASSVGTGMADDEEIPLWARACVAAAIDAGAVYGEAGQDGNRVFRPNDGITVAEAASVLDRALGLACDGREVFFADKDAIPSWAARSVINAFSCGILKTDADNAVNPYKTVTRAEAAQMVCAALEQKKDLSSAKRVFAILIGSENAA
ncbi:MAG: S-layer homology domain-containing protein [Clostridia bacterium]|nr:S-layer homology domain-containing protein [Clostridia bacterium]